jgi:hypothetical protein
MLELLASYLTSALSPDHLTMALTVGTLSSLSLAVVHWTLSLLESADKSDGVVNYPGISQARVAVSFALRFILGLVGLTYTRGALRPLYVVLFEKLRDMFAATNTDGRP